MNKNTIPKRFKHFGFDAKLLTKKEKEEVLNACRKVSDAWDASSYLINAISKTIDALDFSGDTNGKSDAAKINKGFIALDKAMRNAKFNSSDIYNEVSFAKTADSKTYGNAFDLSYNWEDPNNFRDYDKSLFTPKMKELAQKWMSMSKKAEALNKQMREDDEKFNDYAAKAVGYYQKKDRFGLEKKLYDMYWNGENAKLVSALSKTDSKIKTLWDKKSKSFYEWQKTCEEITEKCYRPFSMLYKEAVSKAKSPKGVLKPLFG